MSFYVCLRKYIQHRRTSKQVKKYFAKEFQLLEIHDPDTSVDPMQSLHKNP